MHLVFVVKMTVEAALPGATVQVGSIIVLKIVIMVQMRKVCSFKAHFLLYKPICDSLVRFTSSFYS